MKGPAVKVAAAGVALVAAGRGGWGGAGPGRPDEIWYCPGGAGDEAAERTAAGGWKEACHLAENLTAGTEAAAAAAAVAVAAAAAAALMHVAAKASAGTQAPGSDAAVPRPAVPGAYVQGVEPC